MCKKVIVLGAGASCSYKESPTGQYPPLAKELIPTFHKLSISRNRYVLVGNIINYIRDTRGVSPSEFEGWTEDIEAVFSEIDEKIQISAEDIQKDKKNYEALERLARSMGTYNQLIFLFSSILNEIQNGPVSIPHALLASELSPDDTIVTFNWDTLMDRALFSTGKWFPNTGYCIKPEYIYNDGWYSSDEFLPAKGSPRYIKLHGSTNWLVPLHGVALSSGKPYSLKDDVLNKLFIFFKATHQYKTYKGRYWGPYEAFSYCYYPPDLPGCNEPSKKGYKIVRVAPASDIGEAEAVVDTNIYSMPLIIPPIWNKQYKRHGKIFSELWSQAETAISECHKLYIIGYSFPETDLFAKEMLKRSVANNKNMNRVIIINPYPKRIRDIFSNEFGVPNSKVEVISERLESLIPKFEQIFCN